MSMHCYPKRLRLPKRVTQFECGQRVRSGSKRVQAEAQQVYFVRALWRARGAPGLRLAGVGYRSSESQCRPRAL